MEKRIWLIDDNKALLDLLISCLDGLNVSPRGFVSAQEVLYLMESRKVVPDIIVMDWTLPDLPASHLLDFLAHAYPQARIVVMSGDFNVESQLPFGFMFLAKPFRLAAFRDMVAALAAAVS